MLFDSCSFEIAFLPTHISSFYFFLSLLADSAFARSPTLLTVSRGYVTEPQQLVLEAMLIGSRQCVENAIGYATNTFLFMRWALGLKVLLSPVNVLLSCAWFFVNCLTCCRGSNSICGRFGLAPPSIDDYLSQL